MPKKKKSDTTERTRIEMLIEAMSSGVYEKDHLFALALLGALSGENMFLLGPPGTAKSLVARRLKSVFAGARSFDYLMSRFSTPDEIFGPVSIARLKADDVYERRVEGYLPDAQVVFLDEIWKAGPAIQNALLTAINEKIYQNGTQTLHLDLRALIAASNELPEADEGLEAIWDRFVIRAVSNCIADEKTFYRMLTEPPTPDPEIPKELLLDAGYIDFHRSEADKVELPSDVLASISALRCALVHAGKSDGMQPADFYVSDRRWRRLAGMMRVSAHFNGRTAVDHSDLLLLMHSLWNTVDAIPTIIASVCQAVYADIEAIAISVEEAMTRHTKDTSGGGVEAHNNAPVPPSGFRTYNYFYFKLEGFPKGECYLYRYDYPFLSADTDTPGLLFNDPNVGAFVLGRDDARGPFQGSKGSLIQRVKLRAAPGGVSVDGTVYPLRKESSGVADSIFGFLKGANAQKGQQHEWLDDITGASDMLETRRKMFRKGANLFVSTDDSTLADRQGASLAKRLRSIEMRLQSSL